MKKLFGFGKKDEKAKNEKLDKAQQEMKEYKGQKYNPREDDGITTESMFKIVDGETGERVDVRELLGLTEEDFKNDPTLLDVIKHMNTHAPVEPQDESEESGTNQKKRHFKNFDLLKASVNLQMDGEEFMANPNGVIEKNPTQAGEAWSKWWAAKDAVNAQLIQAITAQNA